MFDRLGNAVSRHWVLVILAWVALAAGLWTAQRFGVAPRWDDVTFDGDLAYLPEEMTSIYGEKLLEQAFPEDRAKSRIVVVIARPEEELTPEDREFVALLASAFHGPSFADRLAEKLADKAAHNDRPILDVLSPQSEGIGRMLTSRDRQSQLVVITLSNEFMATSNISVLDFVYHELQGLWAQAPSGLQWGVTGSATIGGDMLTSAAESIKNTELTTIVLVIAALLIIYRAPLMVFIPLLSIAFSVYVATSIVAILTQLHLVPGFEWWTLKVFTTTKIFVVVILFGAGTDYCLFLIARYEEELSRGLARHEALARALGKVGNALAASALTTIVGMSTMFFASFGKFSSSGPVIAICLAVALLACITLAPALIRALGRMVFWPFGAAEKPQQRWGGDEPTPIKRGLFQGVWQSISRMILARPGLILTVSLLVLLPLAYAGWSVEVTYDLLGELQSDRPSVRGTRLLWEHFPPGETGPVTVLAVSEEARFDTKEGEHQIARLTKILYDIEGVVSVRSITEPLGDKPGYVQPFSMRGLAKLAAKEHRLTKARFVAQEEQFKGRVARFDVILQHDPFSREAIDLLDTIHHTLEAVQQDPNSAWYKTEFNYVGTTAGIRDLKAVTENDLIRIQRLVVLSVLMVLLLILRRPLICFYLILSVLLSYFVTIGVTELFFEWHYGPSFHGLDWKVPLFLFVILIAIGEDYNIYLTTRVFEEQKRLGLREGLRTAVVQTGGIITSCGIIMAGTFVSMMTGTLRGMFELGFALSLGVLLDTFVVRTILVPSFFAILIPRDSEPIDADAVLGGSVAPRKRPTHV